MWSLWLPRRDGKARRPGQTEAAFPLGPPRRGEARWRLTDPGLWAEAIEDSGPRAEQDPATANKVRKTIAGAARCGVNLEYVTRGTTHDGGRPMLVGHGPMADAELRLAHGPCHHQRS